ncbi:aminoglycoside phosphotransferase family protein [Prochlorococcus sp. MIT 1341]|uniref:phosphotransferase enzyme family protein n=1 Tax=Prochlorococcus sp. MIT 1341 TaxID=3096221 RepID=UPI002A75BB09|nr:aminoglycoside phosphotransferase family protein [Prochlorococcus sp. MIT 1341]
MKNNVEFAEIIRTFFLKKSYRILSIDKIRSGNINGTYLIEIDFGDTRNKYVLQQINSEVFHRPYDLMSNLNEAIKHFNYKVISMPYNQISFCIPTYINSNGSKSLCQVEAIFWRLFHYIQDSYSLEIIHTVEQAYSVGYSLHSFHGVFCDLPKNKLLKPIKDFHNTKQYLKTYYKLFNSVSFDNLNFSIRDRVLRANRTIIDNQELITELDETLNSNKLTYMAIHGDPKVSNFLFDLKTDEVSAIIDLDTFYYGPALIDIADCIRSICNPHGEDAKNLTLNFFDMSLFDAFLRGYFKRRKFILTKYDMLNISLFMRIIIYELGIRFLTDYLIGNKVFSIEYNTQNLKRSEVQFNTLLTINANLSEINKNILRYI